MTATGSLAHSLEDLALILENRAVWVARAILDIDVKSRGPFAIVSAVPDGSSLYCILPTGSDRYHGQLVIGVDESGFADLFPEEEDPKIRKDAIGEIANVISSLFVSDDEFIARFGSLRPSTPLFSEGAFTDREDWSLIGRLEANGREILMQFSIRELT